MKRWLLIFMFVCTGSAFAAQEPAQKQPAAQEEAQPKVCPIAKTVGLAEFKKIPVQEDGRIKPLDSYARNILLTFSGRMSYHKQSATQWLARLLFDPQRTREDKIFLINNPLIAETLGIKPEEKRRYSFSELQSVYPKLQKLAESAQAVNSKERNVIENELIRVYQNLQLYSKLSLSFAFALPHPDFTIHDKGVKEEFGLSMKTDVYSYLDLALRAAHLQQSLEILQTRPETQWTDASKEVVQATGNLFHWSMLYHDLPLHFVPSFTPDKQQWSSAWDILPEALRSAEGQAEMEQLQEMLSNYWNGHQIAFDLNVKRLLESFRKRPAQNYPVRWSAIQLELLYNQIQPFFWAKCLYLIAFLLVLLSFIFRQAFFRKLPFWFIVAAFLIQVSGMLMRIIILQRPPVSSLYETFIFVAFIAVLAGFFIERVRKNGLGLFVASLSGLTFLLIAGKFALEGDTLKMLVAVLNSNFWLSTHVLSITTGYAGVCVAGIVGHVYILQAIFKSKDKQLLEDTYKVLLGTLGFGLTMTFLGTNLGGIWADQSWGRFWGWDPKENGALMIILWTAMLFHAKVGDLIGPLGLAVGSVFGVIVVMWAWFGVNLLSIGLHSYGFTSGLATNLTIYVVLQLLFLAITYPLAKRKLK